MNYSSLAKEYIPAAASNHWGARKDKISKIIIHHMAAVWTGKRCAESFADSKRGASATYCIGNDGDIVCGLDETITPGTSGGYEADRDAVTIEVSNSKTGEPWAVSDKALNSLILLCADIAKRNGLGKLEKGKNLCWHQMYAATACPGRFLLSKMDYIAEEANKINYPEKSQCDGTLSGTDSIRKTDELIVYFKGIHCNGRTGTNKWGYEVQIDKNGVVLEDPHYSGNTIIPEGGKVLSGNGKAGEWIYKNIKKGYLVWFVDGKTCIACGTHRSIDSVNALRKKNHLSVYNVGSAAKTNKWGWEATVNAEGHVIKKRYGGKTPIPAGGFVLSGNGSSSTWIKNNVKVGSTITISGNVVKVK